MDKKLTKQLEFLETLESLIKELKEKKDNELIKKGSMLDITMPKDIIAAVFKVRNWLRENKINKVKILGLDWTIEIP